MGGDIFFKDSLKRDLDSEEDNSNFLESQSKKESIFAERTMSLKSVPHFNPRALNLEKINKSELPYNFRGNKLPKSLSLVPTTHSGAKTLAACNHPKILVVDDDEFNVLAVKIIFKQKGFTISSARNGQQAIEVIHSEIRNREQCCKKFSLILMDVNMPVMGGLEAASILKKEIAAKMIPWMPIVACTAFVGSNDEITCRENGMDDYETKPLNDNKITRIIENWGVQKDL